MKQEIRTAKVYGSNGELISTVTSVTSARTFPGGCYLTLRSGGKVDILGGLVIIETPPPRRKQK